MKRYKKFVLVLTVVLLSNFYSGIAFGATKSQQVLNAFENYLDKVESTYEVEISNAANLYQPQINSTQNKISDAQITILSANQVKVLKQGDFRSYWGNFDCSKTRPDCIYVDKGPLFQVGELITIKSLIADKTEYLDEMDIIIKLGLVEITNFSTYQEASKTIRSEIANLNRLNQQYKTVQSSIMAKRDSGRSVEIALLAAQRAAKSPSNYDKAFVVALKFEQNRLKLNELASTPWKYINSYKALSSAISVTRLSDKADIVGENYSYSRALGINSSCGTAFTGENDFKSTFNLVASVYKQATKVSLKI